MLEEEDGEAVVTHAAPRGTARAAETGSSLLGGDKGQKALGVMLHQPDAPESVTTSHAKAALQSSAPCLHVLGAWGQNTPLLPLPGLSSCSSPAWELPDPGGDFHPALGEHSPSRTYRRAC